MPRSTKEQKFKPTSDHRESWKDPSFADPTGGLLWLRRAQALRPALSYYGRSLKGAKVPVFVGTGAIVTRRRRPRRTRKMGSFIISSPVILPRPENFSFRRTAKSETSPPRSVHDYFPCFFFSFFHYDSLAGTRFPDAIKTLERRAYPLSLQIISGANLLERLPFCLLSFLHSGIRRPS